MMRRPTLAMISIVLLAGSLLPASEAPPATEKKHITVEVTQGDTLWGIAVKYLENPGQWKEILEYNRLENPDVIYPGMKLKIPATLLKSRESAKSARPAGPPPAKASPREGGGKEKRPGIIRPGSVIHVARDVVQVDSKGNDETLRVGGVLKPGGKVVTDNLSFCTVNIGGGLMVVGPATRFKVALLEQSGPGAGSIAYLRLVQGIISFATATDLDLRVKTDAVLARANGARFTFRKEDEGRTFVEVYAGAVDITSGGVRKTLGVGQGAVIKAEGDVIGPVELPPAPRLHPEKVTVRGNTHVGARWEHVKNAVSYRMEVALDDDFARPVYFGGYAGDSVDFNFLSSYPPAEYRLRLRSVDKNGLWSSPSNSLICNSRK